VVVAAMYGKATGTETWNIMYGHDVQTAN